MSETAKQMRPDPIQDGTKRYRGLCLWCCGPVRSEWIAASTCSPGCKRSWMALLNRNTVLRRRGAKIKARLDRVNEEFLATLQDIRHRLSGHGVGPLNP